MSNVRHITSMEFAQAFIASATDPQLRDLCAHIGERLFQREKQTAGAASSNFNESGHLAADIVRNLQANISAEAERPCTCGRCDECVAARSDEHHDRKRDGLMTIAGAA